MHPLSFSFAVDVCVDVLISGSACARESLSFSFASSLGASIVDVRVETCRFDFWFSARESLGFSFALSLDVWIL